MRKTRRVGGEGGVGVKKIIWQGEVSWEKERKGEESEEQEEEAQTPNMVGRRKRRERGEVENPG